MNSRTELVDRAGLALIRMIRRVEEAQEKAARSQGMHPTDFRCLGHLYLKGEPLSSGEIADYLGLTSGAGTALLDRLERGGYISRIRHPEDRRGVLVVLNEAAAAEPLALHERIRAEYHVAMEDFSDHDLKAIARFLRRIAALSAEMNEALYTDTEPSSSGS